MVVPREPLPLPVGLLPPPRGNEASCTRRRRAAARRLDYIDQWVREVGVALNWLDGRPIAEDFSNFSAMQSAGLEHIRNDICNLGSPTCTPTAALSERGAPS